LQNVKSGPLFEAINGAVANVEDPGRYTLEMRLAGAICTNILSSLSGEGKSSIDDALLYRFPLFAGLTDFLGRNVPGVNFLVAQTDMNTQFTISDGGIQFSKIKMQGNIFGVAMTGDYWFSDQLDFGVRVSFLQSVPLLRHIVKVVWWPVGKLFEMELKGTLENPVWSATTLSLRQRARLSEEDRGTTPVIGGGGEREKAREQE